MYRGYIKIWRKVKESFIWEDSEALKLWIHLLMDANHQTKEHLFNGNVEKIQRGQLLCGRQSLEAQLGINESKIYRLLNIMEKEQLIEQRKTNAFTLITIVKYQDYQANEQQIEQRVNNGRTTNEQPVNTPKRIKSIKNELKEGIVKPEKKVSLNHKEAVKYFCDAYQLKTGDKYVFRGGKDGSLISDLLKTMDINWFKRTVDLFFESREKFIVEAGYTIGVFCSQINKLQKDKNGRNNGSLTEDRRKALDALGTIVE
jgi:hypothetical protein